MEKEKEMIISHIIIKRNKILSLIMYIARISKVRQTINIGFQIIAIAVDWFRRHWYTHRFSRKIC